MMHSQQLRVLLAVRDAGSLTAAATALGYGVPTIVHHIAALEEHCGVRLVDRDRRGARLTPLGAALADEAEQVVARIAAAERLIENARDAGLATLRIGTFASVGAQLLPAAIRSVREQLQVQIEVVEAEPSAVVDLLRAGAIHAGLIYDFADDPHFVANDLRLRVLLDEPYRVLMAQRDRLTIDRRVDFSRIEDAEWICSRDDAEASSRVLRRVCRSLGYEPNVLMRTDDLTMIHGLVAEGIGYTVAPSSWARAWDGVVDRPAVQDLGSRRTSFVTASGAQPAAVDALYRVLRDLADRG